MAKALLNAVKGIQTLYIVSVKTVMEMFIDLLIIKVVVIGQWF